MTQYSFLYHGYVCWPAGDQDRLGYIVQMHPNEFGPVVVICVLCCFCRLYVTQSGIYSGMLSYLHAAFIKVPRFFNIWTFGHGFDLWFGTEK